MKVPRLRTALGIVLALGVLWVLILQLDHGLTRYRTKQRIATLRSDPSPIRREAAAFWLAENASRIDPVLVQPTSLAALNDPSVDVRRSVGAALVELGIRSAPVIPALAVALKDSDAFVRVLSASGMKTVVLETGQGREIAIPTLIEALKDSNETVRVRAARSLVELGAGDRAVPALAEIARGNSAWNRHFALELLEKIGPNARAAIPSLIDATKEHDDVVRAVAASALVAIGEPDAARPVLEEIEETSQDWEARQIADSALKRIVDEARARRPSSNDSRPELPRRH